MPLSSFLSFFLNYFKELLVAIKLETGLATLVLILLSKNELKIKRYNYQRVTLIRKYLPKSNIN